MKPVLFAGFLAALAVATPAAAQEAKQDFTLVNKTGYALTEAYLAPADSNEWQEDFLGQQQLGALSRVGGEALRVQDDAFARPLADNLVETAQQPRHLVDCLDQGIDLLAQPRLGAAVLAHPLLDQRARQGPDIGFGVEPPADPLDHHHGLLQQQQLRLRVHLD